MKIEHLSVVYETKLTQQRTKGLRITAKAYTKRKSHIYVEMFIFVTIVGCFLLSHH